jgi:hypothetical protein
MTLQYFIQEQLLIKFFEHVKDSVKPYAVQ